MWNLFNIIYSDVIWHKIYTHKICFYMKYSKDYLSTFNHKLTRRPSSLGSKILVVKGQNRKFVDYNKYK